MRVRVWTLEYTPFVMGGSVWQPVSTYVDAEGEYDLGQGFRGYLVISPSGKTFVAEKKSGAFVGPTIQQVQQDIKDSPDTAFMRKQVDDAIIQGKNAKGIEPEKFWKLLKAQ